MVLKIWIDDKYRRFNGTWRAQNNPLLVMIFLLTLILIPFTSTIGSGEGDHSRIITGRTEISNGLANDASFTTVDVFDTDGDGLDEIYLGGAGRSSPRTHGIQAFEYNTTLREWKEFGHGLAGKDSGKVRSAKTWSRTLVLTKR